MIQTLGTVRLFRKNNEQKVEVREFKEITLEKAERLTGGLAQAGQWLARKFVRIWKFIARPSGSGSPACAKPLGR